MSDARVVREVSSVSRGTSDGDLMALRGTRDGAVFTADWYLAAALEGRAFGVNTGTGTSPDTMTTTTLTVAKPDLAITVPAGTTIIPVLIEYSIEDTDGAGVLDVLAMASSATTQVLSGGDSLTIHNMRTDKPNSSNCSAAAVLASSGVTPYTGNFIEFFRGYAGDVTDQHNSSTAQTVATASRFSWTAANTMVPPILTGVSQLCVYCTGPGALTGWITAIWVEFPSSSIV
ncbi:hypothetical protein LCGC14_0830210 [marine sediment metagenome]|uniref:Uncharacterized protein n=1 Tax=marine sediment metagenome TaxID=412755 RepID=A0A0F9SNI1_9ZZZZ